MFVKKVLLGLLVCVLFAGAVLAAVSDSEFISLCMFGSLQQINDAIRNGANVNARDVSGTVTPLSAAAGFNSDPGVITTLANAGADINARDGLGNTALMLAVVNNPNPGVIGALVRAGANINAQDELGTTPLMGAALNISNPEVMITTLLELGADPRIRNNFGMIALDAANMNEKLRNTEALRRLEAASR